MTKIHIPPAALEAVAAVIYEADHPGQRFADASELTRRVYLELARATFEAMVAAWPGMVSANKNNGIFVGCSALILPLPQEGGDE